MLLAWVMSGRRCDVRGRVRGDCSYLLRTFHKRATLGRVLLHLLLRHLDLLRPSTRWGRCGYCISRTAMRQVCRGGLIEQRHSQREQFKRHRVPTGVLQLRRAHLLQAEDIAVVPLQKDTERAVLAADEGERGGPRRHIPADDVQRLCLLALGSTGSAVCRGRGRSSGHCGGEWGEGGLREAMRGTRTSFLPAIWARDECLETTGDV